MRSQLPRLILHFDINGTIVITDPASGRSFTDSLNKALAQGDWDASATYPPSKVQKDNSITKSDLVNSLRWPDGINIDPALCRDGVHHFIFPSFFNAITELAKAKREFTIVFRTFGSDIAEVKKAINAYAAGNHPFYGYAGSEELHLPDTRIWTGRYGGGRFPPEGIEQLTSTKPISTSFTLRNQDDPSRLIEKEDDVLKVLECRHQPRSTVACTDHYHWWRAHNYQPSSGKPIWLTADDDTSHHIFFDDNIHKSATDSIVAVRHRSTANIPFHPLSGADTVSLHGYQTVRVQTTNAILDHNYFLNKIQDCEMIWMKKRREIDEKEGKKLLARVKTDNH